MTQWNSELEMKEALKAYRAKQKMIKAATIMYELLKNRIPSGWEFSVFAYYGTTVTITSIKDADYEGETIPRFVSTVKRIGKLVGKDMKFFTEEGEGSPILKASCGVYLPITQKEKREAKKAGKGYIYGQYVYIYIKDGDTVACETKLVEVTETVKSKKYVLSGDCAEAIRKANDVN